jgi:hypothetical protein
VDVARVAELRIQGRSWIENAREMGVGLGTGSPGGE